MAKKLIVLSLDALQTGDLDLLFQLPYCSQLAEKWDFIAVVAAGVGSCGHLK